jgi:DNA-binding PadR family transcriptional regulator
MKFYRLTRSGKKQLEREEAKWERFQYAMNLVLTREVE